MTAKERREAIVTHLKGEKSPISATALAGLLGVSRQVIVGDVALLRAGGEQIVSTSRGYIMSTSEGMVRQVVCQHSAGKTRQGENQCSAEYQSGKQVAPAAQRTAAYGGGQHRRQPPYGA